MGKLLSRINKLQGVYCNLKEEITICSEETSLRNLNGNESNKYKICLIYAHIPNSATLHQIFDIILPKAKSVLQLGFTERLTNDPPEKRSHITELVN